MSAFWFEHLADVVPNHVVSYEVDDLPGEWLGRTMLVKKAEMLPVECVVRGRLSGTAWKAYKQTGGMPGMPLPAGLLESSALPEPVFTPSTKAELGVHDENISFEQAVDLVG